MKFLITILLLCGGLLKAWPQDNSPANAATNAVPITSAFINQLVEEARANNPKLRAARSRVTAATLGAGSVRTWDDPTAVFGGSVYSDKGFRPDEEGNLAYGIEQKLPLWGRPQLNRRVADSEVSTRRAEVELRAQEVRRDIARGLLASALAERVVEIGEQDLAWLKATAKATENKYRAGQAVIADTLQIQNEAAKRADALHTDHNRLGHEHFALSRLLNRPAESPWPILRLPPVAPAIPLSRKLLAAALQSEPKLKVLEQEIDQARAAAELTRKTRLPDVSLGVEGRQYSGDGEFRSGMFTLRFSLPWFNGDKYRRDYDRDRERQKTAEQEREEQVLMVREVLHHLSVEIEATRREALLYRDEICARATQVLNSRLADWESGHGPFREVLEARRMVLESELMSARAVAEENGLLAELLLWTGFENAEALATLAGEPPLIPEHGGH